MPRAKAKAPERRIRNDDYTDRELLANIAASIGADGYATTTEIAIALGFSANGDRHKTLATKVASRLSWMRAGGLLVSAPPDTDRPYTEPGARDTRWALSSDGEQILKGTLSKAVSTAIDRMEPGSQLLMMRELTRKGYLEGGLATAFAIRREYQHNIAQRRLVYRINTNKPK